MIRETFRRAALAVCLTLLQCPTVYAGIVDYVATPLGGNTWRYDYTITNETPSIGFDELTVYFGVNQFELLNTAAAPAGWDPLAVQPDTRIPADGFYDALSLGGLLAEGASVSGFSVSFVYLIAGSPGAQSFDMLNSADFSVVRSGTTTDASAPVPEPATLALMLLGLGAVASMTRRSLSRHAA